MIILNVGIVAGAIVMTKRVVIHANVIMLNMYVFFGNIFGLALTLRWTVGLDGAVVLMAILPAVTTMVGVILGFWAVLKKRRLELRVHCFVTAVNCGFLAAGAVYLFINAKTWKT